MTDRTRAPDESAVVIGFGEPRVTVTSDDSRVTDALARRFCELIATGTGRLVGDVRVRRAGAGYAVSAGGTGTTHWRTTAQAARRAQYLVLELLIRARSDVVWLHAAAAARSGRAVLMPGRRGRGKSTLVARMWENGWEFLSDDIVPLDPGTDLALPFPQAPAVREDIGRDVPEERVGDLSKSEVWFGDRVAKRPQPVTVIVLPAFRRRVNTELTPVSPGQMVLELMEGCWNLQETGESTVRYLSGLVTRVPLARLGYSDRDQAVARLAEWMDAGMPPP